MRETIERHSKFNNFKNQINIKKRYKVIKEKINKELGKFKE